MDAQTLVLGAGKDRVDNITSAVWEVLLAWKPDVMLREGDDWEGKGVRKMQCVHEEYQESVMKVLVV